MQGEYKTEKEAREDEDGDGPPESRESDETDDGVDAEGMDGGE